MATQQDNLSFLYGANTAFLEKLYARYAEDPASVDASWQQFFATLGDDVAAILAEANHSNWREAFNDPPAKPPRARSNRASRTCAPPRSTPSAP